MRNQSSITIFLAVTGISLVAAPRVRADFANWTDTTSATISTVTVTLSGLTNDQLSLSPFDLTTPDYSAAPGSDSQNALNYLGSDKWTATFSQPLTNFKLYTIFWRGDDAGVDPVTYTFDKPFTILSGLVGASVAGNTLSLPDGSLYEGIIGFSGSISSLSVTSTNIPLDFQDGSGQAMTLNANPVPEPATLILFVGGMIAFGFCRGVQCKLGEWQRR